MQRRNKAADPVHKKQGTMLASLYTSIYMLENEK